MAAKKKLDEQKVKIVAPESPEIGIDTEKTIVDNIIGAAQVGALDTSSIDALANSSQTREQMYQLIDQMSQDEIISAVLDQYASDCVQQNDKGQSVWVESSDSNVLNYTTWLMDSLNIDKHLYQWAHCLVTYGDCYIRLYRKSDYGNDLLFRNNKRTKKLNESKDSKDPLSEDTKLRVYADDDPYMPYVEMVSNPGEMFDLQKFGKSHGYIKAPVRLVQQTSDELYNYFTRYQVKNTDVEIFDATSFAHACLANTNQRQPETIDIFLENYKNEEDYVVGAKKESTYETSEDITSYSVRRGQSILYNAFRIWRELNLLEMSALLNRLTRSAIVRILNIDVGDMPKNQVNNFITRLKEKIEQKSAIDVGRSLAEYNAAGPIENTIYVPTHGTQGSISAQTIGGDFDPKQLTDIEYFRDKLFGALGVPKQFFGFTEDGAGFNGGTSLTILSSQYGKAIKRIQAVLAQLVTDIINLFLIDRGLDNYVNKFQVKMQTPVTQEEKDRRETTDNRIRYVGDLMQQLDGIDDPLVKLRIQKTLLTDVVNDPEAMQILQEYIDKKQAEIDAKEEINSSANEETSNDEFGGLGETPVDMEEPSTSELPSPTEIAPEEPAAESVEETPKEILTEDGTDDNTDSFLPSPADLGLDLTNSDK